MLKPSSTRPCPKSKKNLSKSNNFLDKERVRFFSSDNERNVDTDLEETLSDYNVQSKKSKFDDFSVNQSPIKQKMYEEDQEDKDIMNSLEQQSDTYDSNNFSERKVKKPRSKKARKTNLKKVKKVSKGRGKQFRNFILSGESFDEGTRQELSQTTSKEMPTSVNDDSIDLSTHETAADLESKYHDPTNHQNDNYNTAENQDQDIENADYNFVESEGVSSADNEMTGTFSNHWNDSTYFNGNNQDTTTDSSDNSMFLMPSIPIQKKKDSQKKQGFSRVRKYSYSPITISGIQLQKTLAHLSEPDGYHECQECDAVFSKTASLKNHMSRNHNTNLNSQCPECPKTLSNKNAIKKHLLSHRPKSEWPIECPLCGQRFQAKGDIPKHLFTFVHKGDSRVPEMGSARWFQLIDESVIDEEFASKYRKRANTCL